MQGDQFYTNLQNVICDLSPRLSVAKLKDRRRSIRLWVGGTKVPSQLDGFKLGWEFHHEELETAIRSLRQFKILIFIRCSWI